jgi:cytoskeletal protein CcmA (bactofilin family)
MSVSSGVIAGGGSIAPLNLAGGLNGQATIPGTCTVSASITAKGHIEVTIAGTSTCEGDLSGAVYMTATIAGTSSISDADLRMIASMVSTIAGQATVSGTLTGSVNIEATLTGEGLVYTANLAGGMYIEGTIAGEGTVEGDIIAKGNISATIVVNEAGATLTTDAIAAAVWAALAANNNASGSMGELLNDAGGGSSPEAIADAVAAHAKTLTVPKYLGLK